MELGKCTCSQRVHAAVLFVMIGIVFLAFLLRSDPAAGADPEMEIDHDVVIQNVTFFSSESVVEMHVYNGNNASQIREQYDAASPQQKLDMIDAMEDEVDLMARDGLVGLFNGSYAFTTVTAVDLDSLNLSNPSEDPIILRTTSGASLSQTSYDLPESANAEDIILGTFKMGATIRLELELVAPSKSITKYTIHSPPDILIEELTDGDIAVDKRSVSWTMDNSEDFNPEWIRDLRLRSEFPTIIYEEDIRVNLVLDRELFELTTIHVDINVSAVKVSRYGNLSNSIVKLEYIPADGIRMVVNNGLRNWSWERIYQENIRQTELEIEKGLSDALNVSVELDFYWYNESISDYDVNTMDVEPPIQASLISGDITPHLYAISNETFGVDDIKVAKGFLNAGGKAEFGIPEIVLDLWVTPTAQLILSPGMRLENFTGTEDLEDGGRYSYSWDPRQEFQGTIYSKDRIEYSSSRIEVDILIDVKEIDIEWTDISASSVEIDIIGDLRFYRIETPDEILETMPDGISIDYIIADIIRMAYDHDLIDLEDINEMIDNYTGDLEDELRDSFEDNAYLTIDLDERSLENYDVDDMKESPPIMIVGRAFISVPIAEDWGEDSGDSEGDGGNGGSQSFLYTSLYEFSWDIPMEPIEDFIITYTLVLPRGIIVAEVTDDLGMAKEGSYKGRDSISVTITDQYNNLTITIAITPMLFLDVCMLPIAIIVILIILFVMHRRNKKKRWKQKEREKIELEVLQKLDVTPGRFEEFRGDPEEFNTGKEPPPDEGEGSISKKDRKKAKQEKKAREKELKNLEKHQKKGEVEMFPTGSAPSSEPFSFAPPPQQQRNLTPEPRELTPPPKLK